MKGILVTTPLWLGFASWGGTFCSAFAPASTRNSRPWTTLLQATTKPTKQDETQIRQTWLDRHWPVHKEKSDQAIVDGDRLSAGLAQPPASSVFPMVDDKELQQLVTPKPYPLFVAEKAAEFAEATVGKVFSAAPSSPSTGKRKIVVLGSGWGAAAFLSTIQADLYDVTVISPRNYFLFTPMLAEACVGTVEYRSITEPIRQLNSKAKYIEATANSVDLQHQRVQCESVKCSGNSCDLRDFDVPYDLLVVTVGAQTATFGIPGVVEHCNFLRSVAHARQIRTSIVNCFERASLPDVSEEERARNLAFAVIGAGPTGIEFAAELRDFVEQDGPRFYPDLLKYVRIKVIEASGTVLAPFDKSLQEEAIARMNRQVEITNPEVLKLLPKDHHFVDLMLESSVKKITDDKIYLKDGSNIDYGMAVWAAGNGPLPFTLDLITQLGKEQAAEQGTARGRIAIDPWLRAIGGKGRVLAVGDCSCQTGNPLPATAQVAAQQSEYLANLLNKHYAFCQHERYTPPMRTEQTRDSLLSDPISRITTKSKEYAKPFQFLNLGILAYTGGESALAQVNVGDHPVVKQRGKLGNLVWKGIYLSKQFSMRNRLLVVNDWAKRSFFGRDITRL